MRTERSTAARRFVATAAIALIAAGCSDDVPAQRTEVKPESSAPSTVSSGPTSSAPPTVSPPSVPASAGRPGEAGARAYAGYFIDLLNYATVTGDTTQFRKAYTSCSGCDRYAELFERVYRDGGYIKTKGWQPFSQIAVRQGSDFVVSVQVRSEPQRYQESADAAVQTAEREAYSLRFVVTRRGSAWTITDMQGREVEL